MKQVIDLIVMPIIVLSLVSVFIFGNVHKMYDLETLRTAGETDTVHQYAETIALDALDLYLDPVLASEGILYIPVSNRAAAEAYFKNVTASVYREHSSGRATIIESFEDFKLFPGTYSINSTSNGSYMVQTKSQTDTQRPYIQCNIRGRIKTSTSSRTEEGAIRKTPFKEFIHVYASHIEGNR